MTAHKLEDQERAIQAYADVELQLARNIDELVEDTRLALIRKHKTDPDPGSMPHNVLFVRALRLWQSVTRLAPRGYGTEAMILVRALWETRIQLGYLSADFVRRSLQFRQYEDLYGRAGVVEISRERPDRLQHFGIKEPDEDRLAEDIRAYVEDYGSAGLRRQFRKKAHSSADVIAMFFKYGNWMLRTYAKAADSFGAGMEYEVFYPPTSRMAHGGYEGLRGFTWYANGRTIIEAGPSLKNVRNSLITGGQFMVAVIQELDDELHLGLEARFAPLNRSLLERIRVTTTSSMPFEM